VDNNPGYFRQILRPIVYALQNFDRNFPNLVAPPTDGCLQFVVNFLHTRSDSCGYE